MSAIRFDGLSERIPASDATASILESFAFVACFIYDPPIPSPEWLKNLDKSKYEFYPGPNSADEPHIVTDSTK